MATSSAHDSVNVGESTNETVIRVVPTKRNPEVWSHFDLCEMANGKRKARCHHCQGFYAETANSTLKQHIEKPFCKALKQQHVSGQASMASDAANIFNYNFNMVRDEMAKFVIQESLPFNHFDNQRYTKMVQRTLQPRYTHVSRATLRRDCLKLWKKAKLELISYFEKLETGVNLTSDVWSAPHGSPDSYICVTAHWIEPATWQMMKRTILFKLFDYPHTGEAIYKVIDKCITTYKLENKVFSISFDNASNNTSAVMRLKLKYNPICEGTFFHSRCVAHIINLAVQDGLKVIETQKEAFKRMLRSIFSNTQRHAKYIKTCKEAGRICLGPNWDVAHRWNSTCIMFEKAILQKESLIEFHNLLASRGKCSAYHPLGWETIENVTQVLQVFKTSTKTLSGVYYPTSSLVLHNLFKMCLKVNELSVRGRPYCDMADTMKEKLRKYFKELPAVFTCAAALNPCFNIFGAGSLIEKIAHQLNLNTTQEPNFGEVAKARFNDQLTKLFDVYVTKYGSTASHIHAAMRNAAFGEGSSQMEDLDLYAYNQLYDESSQMHRGNTSSSELGRYGGSNFLQMMSSQEFKNFDLLAWWKSNENQFPILATMARDLLTVQASTVASESAFSISGRVISIRRTRLTPKAVEMSICLKDNLDAAERVQDKRSLEEELDYEGEVYEDEVEAELTTPMTDEEAELDEFLRNSSSSGSAEED
ncbi:putative transcription factor/ chromatin remodeling BED-type(Zn) family [Helianthus annuus]|nr:putative transcription factor/ chromatin remodeling BED-type(Zn) family [Helianthus annuus]